MEIVYFLLSLSQVLVLFGAVLALAVFLLVRLVRALRGLVNKEEKKAPPVVVPIRRAQPELSPIAAANRRRFIP